MAQRLKVLVVDDDPVTLEVTKAVLEGLGHAVLTRGQAAYGLLALRSTGDWSYRGGSRTSEPLWSSYPRGSRYGARHHADPAAAAERRTAARELDACVKEEVPQGAEYLAGSYLTEAA